MSMLRHKLAEVMAAIKHQAAVHPVLSSVEYLQLEAWLETSNACPENLMDLWRALAGRTGMAIQMEKNRLEEEKRRWAGFTNPYLKKLTELIERRHREIDQDKMVAIMPVTACFIREIGEKSLQGNQPTHQKSRYVFERQHIDKTVALFNLEHTKKLEHDFQQLRQTIIRVRQEMLGVTFRLPVDKLQEVVLRYHPKVAYEPDFEEDRYAGEVRPTKSTQQIILANLVKTLRAPTIVLMTGAFVYSILANGSLRDVFNQVFVQYPILLWVFMTGMFGYFIYACRHEMRQSAEEERNERSRIWGQIYSQLRGDIKSLFATRKNDLKSLYTTLRETETEWYANMVEKYIQPQLEENIHPVVITGQLLTTANMEIPRLIAEAQKPPHNTSLPSTYQKN